MPRETIKSCSNSPGGPDRTLLVSWGRDTQSLQIVTSDNADGISGEWVDLNRASANRLIQAVRRGRDAAFGKDA